MGKNSKSKKTISTHENKVDNSKKEIQNLKDEKAEKAKVQTKMYKLLESTLAASRKQVSELNGKCTQLKKELDTYGLFLRMSNAHIEVQREKITASTKIIETQDKIISELAAVKANNAIVRTWGEKIPNPNLKNHVDLLEVLGIVGHKRGDMVAAKKVGLSFIQDGEALVQALIGFGLDFMAEKGFRTMKSMKLISEVRRKYPSVHLVDDVVTSKGDAKSLFEGYPISENINSTCLPLKYAGFSQYIHKEASIGGIFKGGQFDQIEQLAFTSPNGNASSDMHEEMIKNAEEFYQMLKLPYRVLCTLNIEAAKTYDLEAWFPASNSYQKLLSCSNWTDYQSTKLDYIEDNQETKKNDDVFETTFEDITRTISDSIQGDKKSKHYCHALDSTLTDTVRTICCILENYQREDGVQVPEVLHPYMNGKKFLYFPSPSCLRNIDLGL